MTRLPERHLAVLRRRSAPSRPPVDGAPPTVLLARPAWRRVDDRGRGHRDPHLEVLNWTPTSTHRRAHRERPSVCQVTSSLLQHRLTLGRRARGPSPPSRRTAGRRRSHGLGPSWRRDGSGCHQSGRSRRSADRCRPRRHDRRSVASGGSGRSGPELALEPLLGLVDGALVGAGGQVLPAAVADDERDVGALAGLDRLGGLRRARRAGSRRWRCRRRCPRARAARGRGVRRRAGRPRSARRSATSSYSSGTKPSSRLRRP